MSGSCHPPASPPPHGPPARSSARRNAVSRSHASSEPAEPASRVSRHPLAETASRRAEFPPRIASIGKKYTAGRDRPGRAGALLDAEAAPERVDLRLDLGAHDDVAWPRAGEPFGRPLARRVDPDLASPPRHRRGVVERLRRACHDFQVAAGVDVPEGTP